ncbi:hypothetical protein ACJVC5_12360 [Peredibacter sp. HCB2-198]|uniref:hypothetical protein n=1 Tax=Peredibacter sp. HCB2-198 TaxID=3383025 RepID=UPI0038B4ACE5
MKKSFVMLSLVLAQTFSFSANAELIGRNWRYLHIPSGMQVELDNVNEQAGTATYFDYQTHKKVKINLSDVSREIDSGVNGVKAGHFVLVNFDKDDVRHCQVYRVFEIGTARIGCQSGKIRKNIGVDRPQVAQYNASVYDVTGEVESMEGFSKKEKVKLATDAGNLKAGTTVRIEAIFSNGEALIQKMGANLLDTSGLLLKYNIERVSLNDLEKK